MLHVLTREENEGASPPPITLPPASLTLSPIPDISHTSTTSSKSECSRNMNAFLFYKGMLLKANLSLNTTLPLDVLHKIM